MALEQEVKLAFNDVEAARLAVTAAGGRLVASRRLLDDRLFDGPDQRLSRGGLTLRLRRDGQCGALLAFKDRVQPADVKTREEFETTVGDTATTERILRGLGFRPVFRAQKYREDWTLGRARVSVDETPFGVFVEIEGTTEAIAGAAAALGRSPADYRRESYPMLWRRWCEAQGRPAGDMLLAVADAPP